MGIDPGFWSGRSVLVTGHTGFKGVWLSIWLAQMGARISGLALAPSSHPNLFELTGLAGNVRSVIADINDRAVLDNLLTEAAPDVVFHLAAQALVRMSYQDPVGTFATNVGGVVSLLDAVRRAPSVRAVVIVTSDKCYDNQEWVWGYRENDPLGGHDPYSASKGAAEMAAHSMRMSFFEPHAEGGHAAKIATVRAGNVIGGGDWSDNRLVPDIVRGCLGTSGEVHIRNPSAVRPWQHVLEPVAAYLRIAELLAAQAPGIDEAWNIGPDSTENRAVLDLAEALIAELGAGHVVCGNAPTGPHEATLLALDCAKAKARLGWRPVLAFEQCIALTADWYAAWQAGRDMAAFTQQQILSFQQIGTDASAGGPTTRRST